MLSALSLDVHPDVSAQPPRQDDSLRGMSKLMAMRKSSSKKTTSKKSSGRKYGKAAGKTVASAMRRKKSGTLKSGKGGKGGKVKSRKQAIAIGLSEARKKGAKVPKKKSA
jgi:hypothetical protein